MQVEGQRQQGVLGRLIGLVSSVDPSWSRLCCTSATLMITRQLGEITSFIGKWHRLTIMAFLSAILEDLYDIFKSDWVVRLVIEVLVMFACLLAARMSQGIWNHASMHFVKIILLS